MSEHTDKERNLMESKHELRQRNESLDAKRYRWLRVRDLETISKGGVFAGLTPDNRVLNGDDLDTAIDDAMRGKDNA